MSDRPTFWEFTFHRRGNVVKTLDDRYMILSNTDEAPDRTYAPWRWLLVLIILLIFVVNTVIALLELHPNFLFDYICFGVIAACLDQFIRYRRAKFKPVDSDTIKLFEVDEWFVRPTTAVRRARCIIASSLLLAFFTFAALNSVCFSYVRCLVSDTPRVIVINLLLGENAGLVDPDSPSLLYRVDENYGLFIDIAVAQTTQNAAFTLDGAAVRCYMIEKPVFFFWQPAFPAKYSLVIDNDDLHDGSTLTLDCGSLHREWVFDVAEGDDV